VVCEEVCPTSPKAIYTQRQTQTIRDGKKIAVSSTEDTVTVAEWPAPGQVTGDPVVFDVNQWKGDETTSYRVSIRHADGVTEQHRIAANEANTLQIEGRFARRPEPGSSVTILIELKVPKVDTGLCIGCGICERECPVVGDRRAVYVTAEGETRSQDYPERDRNRSLRLIKTATGVDAGGRREPDGVDSRGFLT
jgi:ferredoxin